MDSSSRLFLNLPWPIWVLHILTFFSAAEILELETLNSEFYLLMELEETWKTLFEAKFPHMKHRIKPESYVTMAMKITASIYNINSKAVIRWKQIFLDMALRIITAKDIQVDWPSSPEEKFHSDPDLVTGGYRLISEFRWSMKFAMEKLSPNQTYRIVCRYKPSREGWPVNIMMKSVREDFIKSVKSQSILDVPGSNWYLRDMGGSQINIAEDLSALYFSHGPISIEYVKAIPIKQEMPNPAIRISGLAEIIDRCSSATTPNSEGWKRDIVTVTTKLHNMSKGKYLIGWDLVRLGPKITTIQEEENFDNKISVSTLSVPESGDIGVIVDPRGGGVKPFRFTHSSPLEIGSCHDGINCTITLRSGTSEPLTSNWISKVTLENERTKIELNGNEFTNPLVGERGTQTLARSLTAALSPVPYGRYTVTWEGPAALAHHQSSSSQKSILSSSLSEGGGGGASGSWAVNGMSRFVDQLVSRKYLLQDRDNVDDDNSSQEDEINRFTHVLCFDVLPQLGSTNGIVSKLLLPRLLHVNSFERNSLVIGLRGQATSVELYPLSKNSQNERFSLEEKNCRRATFKSMQTNGHREFRMFVVIEELEPGWYQMFLTNPSIAPQITTHWIESEKTDPKRITFSNALKEIAEHPLRSSWEGIARYMVEAYVGDKDNRSSKVSLEISWLVEFGLFRNIIIIPLE